MNNTSVSVFGNSVDAVNRVSAAKKATLDIARTMSEQADAMGVKYHEILEAFGEAHPIYTPAGAYFRTQGLITRFLGTLGGLIISVVGIVGVIFLLRKIGGSVINMFKSVFTALRWVGGAVSSIFLDADGPQDALVYDGEVDAASIADGIEATIVALAPAPVGMLFGKLGKLFESASGGGYASNTAGSATSIPSLATTVQPANPWAGIAQTGVSLIPGIGAVAAPVVGQAVSAITDDENNVNDEDEENNDEEVVVETP